MTPDVPIMSMKAWGSLSPTDQNIFRNAARDSSIFLRGQWKNWEASFRKQALDLDVTVIEIDRKPLEAALTGGNSAPVTHTTAERRSSGLPTNPSMQCRRHDCAERSSSLRRRLPSPRHVFRHGSPPDIDAKLEQFAVDPRCSPKRVRDAHVANELANIRRYLWPATVRSRFPPPIGSEPSTVPADHRLRLENFQGVQYSRSQTIEPRKHQAVNVAESQSLGGFARQHVQLVSKDKDLCFQRSPRPEQPDQGAPDQPAKIAHRERVSADSRARSAVFGLR
jgi:hypothetical protein